MWLDRLAGHSTPSGTPPPFNSRPYSPARRSSRPPPAPQAFRPSVHPRSSSTSFLLTPNESTTSLPSTARTPSNGTPYQSGLSRTRPPDTPDPLSVLNGIIGSKLPEKSVETPLDKPKQLVDTVDFQGLSLEEFVAQGEKSGGILNNEAGAQTIQQCMCSEASL